MKESLTQSKVIKKLKASGYFVTKIIQSSTNGIPDLLAIKNGKVFFVEIKSEKGKLSKLQEYRINQLKDHGVVTHIINNIDQLCTTKF